MAHARGKKQYPYVYFDLETTGFENPDVIQIGAVLASGDEFSAYIKPSKAVEAGATQKTGMTYNDGVLRRYGKAVPTIPMAEALHQFFAFIGDRGCILVAHFGHRFDGPLLRHIAVKEGLQAKLDSVVHGLMDSLLVFKEWRPRDLYKLDKLVEKYVGGEPLPHDALKDAVALKAVVERAGPPNELMVKYTIPITGMVYRAD